MDAIFFSKEEAYNLFCDLSNSDIDREEMYRIHGEAIYNVYYQIENTVKHLNNEILKEISNIKTLRNRTIYVGDDNKFPNGCRECLLGYGLIPVRKTNKCNLDCKFCYYHGTLDKQLSVGEGMWNIGGTSFYENDLNLLLNIYGKPSAISYVYLEPFMEIELYYSIISFFYKQSTYQHMYTNGTLASEETLRRLGRAGLDELRFNLAASNCSDEVINNIGIAKKYIRHVGIESPMTPEFYETLLHKREKLFETNLDFINFAELHINPLNVNHYKHENLYISRKGYISPIWSRNLTLKLMQIASHEKWQVVVHDCSNDTKFARDLQTMNNINMPFGSSLYNAEFPQTPIELFLPVLSDTNFEFIN